MKIVYQEKDAVTQDPRDPTHFPVRSEILSQVVHEKK